MIEGPKEKARQSGLWNLFLSGVSGFTQLEYAPMAEEMGRYPLSPETFNCNSPDTGVCVRVCVCIMCVCVHVCGCYELLGVC